MDKAVLRRTAPALATVVIIAGYLVWQAGHLGGFSYGYDEGVYAQSAWLLQSGHGLFSEIFSSQPPLFVSSLAAVFALTGPSMPIARLLVVLFSLLSLGGVGVVAWRGAGRAAGALAIALLAINPNFILYSRVSEADIPSVSLAATAIALATIYQWRGKRWWLVGSAILFSLALFAKLLVAPAALALVLAVLLRHFSDDQKERRGAARKAVLDLVLVAALVAVPWVATMAIYGPETPMDQLVTFHLRAQEVYPPSLLENLREVTSFALVDPGLLALSLFGIVTIALKKRLLTFSPVLIWLAGSWLFLLDQAPLFSHHVVAILPPLAVLAGAGLKEGLLSVAQVWSIRGPRLRMYALPAVTSVLIVIYLAGVPRLLTLSSRSGISSKAKEETAVTFLAGVTASGRYVVSDEQMISFAAGRMVPAGLTDTSSVRIDTGYLPVATLIKATEESDAQAVVFWTGRFLDLPGYLDWVKSHYRLARSFDDSREIYVKP